jgi:hypothetical protein
VTVRITSSRSGETFVIGLKPRSFALNSLLESMKRMIDKYDEIFEQKQGEKL